MTKSQSSAQFGRQMERKGGKYAAFQKCDCGCGKPVNPQTYASHPMTDDVDAEGEAWNDIAIMLHPSCSKVVSAIKTVREFVARRDALIAKRNPGMPTVFDRFGF